MGIDLDGELKRIESASNLETYDRSTDSLEAIRDFLGAWATYPLQGLCYYGVVTAIPGANQFTILALAGLGAGKFSDATAPYRAFVFRDAGGAGAAPQGEMQTITGYTTATGVFTTAAFTAAVAVGDEILILHPRLAEIVTILADMNVPAADAVANAIIRDVTGNKTDTALQALAATASLMRYIKGLITFHVAQAGATGIFHEQADTAVNITAIVAAETDVLNLAAANTRYVVRSLRLKCADPGANTVTVRLYELVNDGFINVDSFAIVAANFATYHSMMDMWGLPHLAGDRLQVTVQASAGGPYAVTGQYSMAKTSV